MMIITTPLKRSMDSKRFVLWVVDAGCMPVGLAMVIAEMVN